MSVQKTTPQKQFRKGELLVPKVRLQVCPLQLPHPYNLQFYSFCDFIFIITDTKRKTVYRKIASAGQHTVHTAGNQKQNITACGSVYIVIYANIKKATCNIYKPICVLCFPKAYFFEVIYHLSDI